MLKSALTLLGLVLLLPYACAPVYRFADARPFAGDAFYNPYASVVSPSWKRANLHAHGRAWLGLTSAKQTDAEVSAAYRARGYDVVVISDYQHVASPSESSLPTYEHGYNVGKHHQLGIGATSVAWFDLPLWQGRHQKQYVISQVAARAALVALCHPAALQGYAYGDDELDELSGYQLMEVVNGPFTTESSWDAALSAGRAVWVVGNDDTHDVHQPDRFATAWNMIASPTTNPADVIEALRAGRTYAVLNAADTSDRPPQLAAVQMRGNEMTVTLDGGQGDFSFVGQNGEVRRTVNHAASASYTFTPTDTYVRARVNTASHVLFLNPVVRYDGRALPTPTATVDALWTWIERSAIALVAALLVGSIVRRHTRRGRGGSDKRWAWPRVAAWAVMVAACTAGRAGAQDAPAPLPSTILDRAPFDTTYDAAAFPPLPTGDSIFTVIETTNVETIADRISTGGLGFGSAPHLSAFGSSITQTRYRIGDIDVTSPSTGGAPMFLPDINLWQTMSVDTGVHDVRRNNAGLTVALEPRLPTTAWRGSFDASSSFGDALTSTPASTPAIARLTGWNRGSALVSGPLVPDTAGIVVGGSLTHESEAARASTLASDSDTASLFAHLVVKLSGGDEVRTFGGVQRTTFPAANAAAFATVQPSLADTSFHVQSTWLRDQESDRPWRLFGAYTQQHRSPQSALATAATADRLLSGPIEDLDADTGARTDRRVTVGGRANATHGAHALEAGAELAYAASATEPGFAGTVLEQVDGLPARMWTFATPAATSHRSSTTIALYGSDHIAIGTRASLDAALRFEHLGGSADGAAQGISWWTALPRAMFRSTLSQAHHVDWFVGGGLSAYQLPLDVLAWGDPGAPSIDVSTAAGSLLYNVGPGRTGRIDPNLKRPYTYDLTFGIQARPARGVAIELAGLTRWDRQLFGVVNVSPNAPRYTTVDVADPGLDLPNPADDQVLHVFNVVPPGATPYSYDNLLTNAAGATARRLGAKLSVEYTAERLFVMFGAAAYEAEGRAASRGYQSGENDQGLVGEDPLFPNATLFDTGRLFGDRAFAGKVAAIYRFPADVTFGATARYHDGQPFSRLVVVPTLNQGTDFVRAFDSGGSRFTFTATLDVRLQKTFAVQGYRVAGFVDGYNLTNRSDEVEERAVTGAAFRTPTAFQPPRTFRLGARVEF